MQGLTGSQTKSCTFKGLRDETVAGDAHPATIDGAVTNCKIMGYAVIGASARASPARLFPCRNPLDAHIRAKHFRDDD